MPSANSTLLVLLIALIALTTFYSPLASGTVENMLSFNCFSVFR